MSLLPLPEFPQLAGVLPGMGQSATPGSQSAQVDPITGMTPAQEQNSYDLYKKATSAGTLSQLENIFWFLDDLPRIGTFLLGLLLIAGAIFAPRDIKGAVTTAAKAAAL